MATRAVKEVVVMGGGLMGTGIAQVPIISNNQKRMTVPSQIGGGTGTAEGGPG